MNILKAVCAAAILAPLVVTGADAAGVVRNAAPQLGGQGGGGGGGGGSFGGGGGFSGPQSGGGQIGPPPGGGGGGFRGNRGYRGYRYGGYYGGGVFFGPGLGYYDPFWWPYPYRYGFGYSYYPYYGPTRVIVRESAPPPEYLGEPDGPAPQANWYYCRDPEGYYPYVRTCNSPWQEVPVDPAAGSSPPG